MLCTCLTYLFKYFIADVVLKSLSLFLHLLVMVAGGACACSRARASVQEIQNVKSRTIVINKVVNFNISLVRLFEREVS